MNNIKDLGELLKGCYPIKDNNGNIIVQSIMNMDIVCLTTDDEYSLDSRFGNPLESVKASNYNYGQIILDNNTDKEIIIPTQIAVMTKQNAQNHGMIKGAYLRPKTSTVFNDAGCVQGSQTGHFNNTNEFRLMPITVREMSFESVGDSQDYSRIYDAVEKLGDKTNSNNGKYLDKYYSKNDKKLEEFIAHFERPEKVIGVIVFIDGEIIAIDKFPSFTYGKQIWDLLIRDCYGSLAIISELKSDKTKRNDFTKNFIDLNKKNKGKFSYISDMENALKKTMINQTKNISEKINELIDFEFDIKADNEGYNNYSDNNVRSFILKSDGYVGQVITENGADYNHLISIVKRERFDPNALRYVNEFKQKARKQQRFGL